MATGAWVIIVGAVLALVGFGRLGLEATPDENAAFNQQWGMVCRFGGLALIPVGAAILVIKFGIAGVACALALAGIAILVAKLLARNKE